MRSVALLAGIVPGAGSAPARSSARSAAPTATFAARLETGRSQGVVEGLSRFRSCTLFAPSGRRTIFTSTLDANVFEWPRILAGWERGARVVEVAVAEAR
jgi:hypothetical protein